jgi:hypothetical protein
MRNMRFGAQAFLKSWETAMRHGILFGHLASSPQTGQARLTRLVDDPVPVAIGDHTKET